MIARAISRYVRMSPRKVRMVINLIRGKSAERALDTLSNLDKAAAGHVKRVLKSAISNAKRNPSVNTESLYISKITADGGPMLKRFRAAAMGRAVRIRKRTSHIKIELDLK